MYTYIIDEGGYKERYRYDLASNLIALAGVEETGKKMVISCGADTSMTI